MQRTSSALTTTIIGAAIAASTVSAQQFLPSAASRKASSAVPAAASDSTAAPGATSPGDSGIQAGTDPIIGMAATRGARHLLRNGLDYINYQEYERALKYLREAEARQKELGDAERLALKKAIERAQRGLREAIGETPYALSRRSTRPGGFALAQPANQLAATATARRPAVPADADRVDQPVRRAASHQTESEDQGQPIRLAGAELTSAALPAAAPRQADLGSVPVAEEMPRPLPIAADLSSAAPPEASVPKDLAQAPSVEPTAPQAMDHAAAAAAAQADLLNPLPSQEPAVPSQTVVKDEAASPRAAAPIVTPLPRDELDLIAAQEAAKPPVVETAAAADPASVPAPGPSTSEPPLAEPAAAAAAAETSAPLVVKEEVVKEEKEAAVAPDPIVAVPVPTPAVIELEHPADAGPKPATVSSSSDDTSVKPAATEPAATEPAAPVASVEPAASAEPAAGDAPIKADEPPLSGDKEDAAAELPPLPPQGASEGSGTNPEAGKQEEAPPAVAAAPDDLPPLPLQAAEAGQQAAAESPAPAAEELPPLPASGSTEPQAAAPAVADPKPSAPVAETVPAESPAPGPGTPDLKAAAEPTPVEPREAAPSPAPDALAAPAIDPAPATTPAPEAVPVPAVEPAASSASSAPAGVESAEPTPLPAEPARDPLPARRSAPPLPPPTASEIDSILPRRRVSAPNLHPELQRQVDEVARRQEAESRLKQERPAPPPEAAQPLPEEEAPLPDRRSAAATQVDISRAPSPAEARPIRAIPVPDDWVPMNTRDWTPQSKYWAAAATCHMPLYFQDAMLERYGHSVEQYFGPSGRFAAYPVDDPTQSTQRNQIAQPFFSAGLFAWQIITWPYALVVDPPWEAQYDLGYWRPGDKIPTDLYYQPLHGTGPPLRGRRY